MFGVNFKNKREKKAVILGLVGGFVLGAFLPDKYNPTEIVKRMLNKSSY